MVLFVRSGGHTVEALSETFTKTIEEARSTHSDTF